MDDLKCEQVVEMSPDRFYRSGVNTGHWAVFPDSWSAVPEERLLSAEVQQLLTAAIAELPPEQRVIIALRVSRRLRDPGPVAGEVESRRGLWRTAWPTLLHEGAVLMCVGAAYTALPPLLVVVGVSADVAGPVLAVFAFVGILGGLGYGSRTWPGPYRSQTVALVLAVCAAVAAAAAIVGGLAEARLTRRTATAESLLTPVCSRHR